MKKTFLLIAFIAINLSAQTQKVDVNANVNVSGTVKQDININYTDWTEINMLAAQYSVMQGEINREIRAENRLNRKSSKNEVINAFYTENSLINLIWVVFLHLKSSRRLNYIRQI